MSILHDSLRPDDHGIARTVIDSITKWQVTFTCGFNGVEMPHDDLIPHPERKLAYEIGQALREGMERMEVEPSDDDDIIAFALEQTYLFDGPGSCPDYKRAKQIRDELRGR